MEFAKILDAQLAQTLCDGEVPVFTDPAGTEFYTYLKVAEKYIDRENFDLIELSQNEVEGTLPLPKGNRPIFPRNKARKITKAS